MRIFRLAVTVERLPVQDRGYQRTEIETQPLFLVPGSRNPGKSSDRPGLYQPLISGLMVVAKRLGPVVGPVWLRISSSHKHCGQEGGICHMIRIGA